MTDDDDKDPKVKALIERDPSQPLDQFVDAATAAQLERWFGLPSFAEVESKGRPEPVERVEDPEVVAVRERRLRLAEEIDKALLASIVHRHTPPDDLLKFVPSIEPIKTDIAVFDSSYADLPDARHYNQPEYIAELLKENTPQALLRDLHRLDINFDRSSGNGEFVNMEDPVPPEPLMPDLRREIKAVMTTRYQAEPVEFPDISTLNQEFRFQIRQPWAELPKRARMINRRITE